MNPMTPTFWTLKINTGFINTLTFFCPLKSAKSIIFNSSVFTKLKKLYENTTKKTPKVEESTW